MVKNLSENARLRQFLSRGAEEMWNCRFPIDSNLEKGGYLRWFAGLTNGAGFDPRRSYQDMGNAS